MHVFQRIEFYSFVPFDRDLIYKGFDVGGKLGKSLINVVSEELISDFGKDELFFLLFLDGHGFVALIS